MVFVNRLGVYSYHGSNRLGVHTVNLGADLRLGFCPIYRRQSSLRLGVLSVEVVVTVSSFNFTSG